MARQVPDKEVLKKAGMQSVDTDGLNLLQECLVSDYLRKFSMERSKKESALMVVERYATKTPLKPS